MSLVNKRGEYSWPRTTLANLVAIPEKREFSLDETIGISVSFRVIGGLRESFSPNVWTVAWEDNDKLMRLMMETSLLAGASIVGRKLESTGREVRRARFYWSRDPDLPYRIWAAIIHEEGGAPIIPVSVEDGRSKFFDVVKSFKVPAARLGKGNHKLSGQVDVEWNRRSYIEKGTASGRTKPTVVIVE